MQSGRKDGKINRKEMKPREENIMTNKEVVLWFYEEVFNAWDLSKLDEFMRDDYIQHNPTVEDGKEGFKKFAEFFFSMSSRDAEDWILTILPSLRGIMCFKTA